MGAVWWTRLDWCYDVRCRLDMRVLQPLVQSMPPGDRHDHDHDHDHNHVKDIDNDDDYEVRPYHIRLLDIDYTSGNHDLHFDSTNSDACWRLALDSCRGCAKLPQVSEIYCQLCSG